MSLAGAIRASLNLAPVANTTTIESKANFVGAAPLAAVVRAETSAVHVGRRSPLWQIRITPPDGKLLAPVTQTPLIV